jgi:hypothetical protein
MHQAHLVVAYIQGVALRQQGGASQDSVPHGQQPQWVAAARLGAALQASRVVPGMHAAAGRERRLAAAAAVARQQLNLGLTDVPDAVLSAAGDEQQLQPEAQRQLQQMLELTQGVVQQNQLLQQAMQDHQAQLSKHEVKKSDMHCMPSAQAPPLLTSCAQHHQEQSEAGVAGKPACNATRPEVSMCSWHERKLYVQASIQACSCAFTNGVSLLHGLCAGPVVSSASAVQQHWRCPRFCCTSSCDPECFNTASSSKS